MSDSNSIKVVLETETPIEVVLEWTSDTKKAQREGSDEFTKPKKMQKGVFQQK